MSPSNSPQYMREYRQRNNEYRERQKRYLKEWRQRNKDRIRAYTMENRGMINALKRNWYYRHRDKILADRRTNEKETKAKEFY